MHSGHAHVWHPKHAPAAPCGIQSTPLPLPGPAIQWAHALTRACIRARTRGWRDTSARARAFECVRSGAAPPTRRTAQTAALPLLHHDVTLSSGPLGGDTFYYLCSIIHIRSHIQLYTSLTCILFYMFTHTHTHTRCVCSHTHTLWCAH